MHGRGVMFNANENIPRRVLDIYFNFKDLETIFLETIFLESIFFMGLFIQTS